MSQEPLQELLTLKQASELLKVHPNTLRAWDKKGILKAVRIGVRGLRRYKREDLVKFTEHK
jgi:excisionase family DNA binding protein